MRARRAAERDAERALAMDRVTRAAEARQVGLPLPAVVADPGQVGDLVGRSGRPAGSVQRSTQQLRDYMLGRYRPPLQVLMEAYSRPVDELVRMLQCSPLEAFKLQLDAARDAAKYVHSAMPTAVQLEGPPVVGVQIAVSPEKAAAIGVATGPGFRLPKVLEHQGLSGGDDA